MNKDKNSSLASEIRKVLKNYLKTQFVLVIISVVIVWGIMLLVPEYHILIEILIASVSYLILSQIMDYFVSPYLLGRSTKVSPLLLIASFIIGITFMGILGALIAVPIALVIKTVWEYNSR